MRVTRSILCGVVGPCKTESSQKPVPVHPTVLEALAKWKDASRYIGADDWVFARNDTKVAGGQAILPAKHAAQAAVLALVFASETSLGPLA